MSVNHNPSTEEAEAGGSCSKACLDYKSRPCLKLKQNIGFQGLREKRGKALKKTQHFGVGQ